MPCPPPNPNHICSLPLNVRFLPLSASRLTEPHRLASFLPNHTEISESFGIMVSDSEIVSRLREFLSTSDLNTTTTGIVRRKLEEDFGISLSDKKVFIREQVDLYLQSQHGEENNDEEEQGQVAEGQGGEEEVDDQDEDEEDEEEENQKANVKSEESSGSDSMDECDEEVEESSNGKGTKKRGSKNKEVKKRGGGFAKLCSLSPKLQEFTGVPEMARTEVVKRIWAYIKEKDLQDPSNRRNILCDETLHALFGVNSINMFQMNKVLAKHIWPLDLDGATPPTSMSKEKKPKQEGEDLPVKYMPKEKKRKQEREEEGDERERKEKGQKSGFLAPVQLSDALVKFLGTNESALSRSEVIKRIWDYIKQNNLQDPSNKRRILSDEKLKQLFDVDSFIGFTMSKYLSAHFIKAEQ